MSGIPLVLSCTKDVEAPIPSFYIFCTEREGERERICHPQITKEIVPYKKKW
jgi:hypothetical protein